MPTRASKKVRQLTPAERQKIHDILGDNGTPTEALARINGDRCHKKIRPVAPSTVHRFCKGATHKIGKTETRGRKKILTQKHVLKLDRTGRRLIKKANNQKMVTYADIIEEADLDVDPGLRSVQDSLRSEGVSFKTPRKKILISDADAKVRYETSIKWDKRRQKYWTDDVHGYYDGKNFPLSLTPEQRSRLRQTMVTGHLRKPSEGIAKGFTKPREKHSFLGIPSITICAAVAKDRIIMWHEVVGPWNGEAAANMYENQLKPALVRTWGKRSRYTIIEDGDRKGNRSNKGIAAKARANIHATTLPPRTPSLMPLDYAIWQRIVKKNMETAPAGTESKDDFLRRLRKTSKSLPKKWVRSQICRMKSNVHALKEARGWVPKND